MRQIQQPRPDAPEAHALKHRALVLACFITVAMTSGCMIVSPVVKTGAAVTGVAAKTAVKTTAAVVGTTVDVVTGSGSKQAAPEKKDPN